MRKVIIIAALGKNREIGQNGQLLGAFPEDLRRFRKETLGGVLVVGRKTFESLPMMIGRRLFVLSSGQPDSKYNKDFRLFSYMTDLLKAVKAVPDHQNVFVIGGASVYKDFVENCQATEMILTHIDEDFPEADAFFPEFGEDQWKIVSEESFMDGETRMTTRKYVRI